MIVKQDYFHEQHGKIVAVMLKQEDLKMMLDKGAFETFLRLQQSLFTNFRIFQT
jgi:hypothetical protein